MFINIQVKLELLHSLI